MIILQYVTDKGFEWLDKEITFNDLDWKSVIDNYILENEPVSNSLVNKWNQYGEEVSMFPDVIRINVSDILWDKIYKYVEGLV